MSEFLAEAQVLIRPNTAAFRAELTAQLLAVTRGLAVPIPVAVAPATSAATTALITTQAAQTVALAGAQDVLTASTTRATASQAQFKKGLLASAASVTGLRGAVLAASGPFILGAIAAAAFGKSLQLFAQFETELNVFAATTGATANEMERVSAAAVQLGADITLPAVSSADAASAMTELAKAGLSVEDTLAGVRGVLQLSTAANIGVGEAAEFAANALNSFGLAGDQASRVADVLANAANSAQGSISDFGLAFQQASAVARQVGFSLEETATTLTILAQNGLRGSDAGTSLRVALLRLINPTEKAKGVIEDLGIEIRDAQGNIRPDVFVQFGEATRSFAPAMRDAALATVFGADAIRAVAIASREGRAGLLEVTNQINEQGTAADLASARTAGLAGQTEALKNNFSTAAIEAGKLAAVIAGPLLVATNALVTAFRNTIAPFTKLVDLVGSFKGPDFDPSTASAAEFLEEVSEIREEMEKFGEVGDYIFEKKFPAALEGSIGALEQQRAQFKALGLDVTALNVIIDRLEGELENIGDTDPGKKPAASLSPLQKAAKDTRDLIKSLGAEVDTTGLKKSLAEIEIAMLDAAEKARFAGAALINAIAEGAKSTAKPAARNILLELQEQALDISIGGGGSAETIANLRKQETQQRALIDALSGAPAKRQQAKEELDRILTEIASIQESERNEVKTLARKAEARARQIAADLLAADRDVADALIGGRGGLENLILRASGTKGLKDDIRFTTALRNLIQRQIDEARKRIKDVGVRKAFIDASNRLLIQLLLDIKRDKEQTARDAAAALRTEQAKLTEGVELDVELADINENTKKRIALRQKLIAQLLKERNVLHLTGNTLKENRNEIARINAEIEEIRKEGEETGRGFAGLAFDFLQMQQGFAANLLGNLIPGSATGGLVGGSQAASAPPPTAVIQAQSAASRQTGPTYGQAATEVDILKQVLQVLREIQRGRAHPEATYQRATVNATMDFQGGV